jgi:hypothetical protein
MGLDGLRRALALSLAARDAALAGDVEHVQVVLEERTPYLGARDLRDDEVESARAILIQIQQLDAGTTEVLLDLQRQLERERGQLRRAGRARAAYYVAPTLGVLDRAG